MAKQTINISDQVNTTAIGKMNSNFTELYDDGAFKNINNNFSVGQDINGILTVSNDVISNGTSPGFFIDYEGTFTGGKGFFVIKEFGNLRWAWGHGGIESGGNAGSNFQLFRYSDAGSILATAFHVERSTGNVGIGTTSPGSRLSISGIPTSSTGLTSGDVYRASDDLRIVA